MNGFELIFELFALLLGLAIAEVLAGFARTWKARMRAIASHERVLRIGWLVPLLGLLVINDQTSFWLKAYALRDAIPFNYFALLVVLLVIGGYYLLATFIFPDEPDEWPDFDDYYLKTNRIVLGGMLAINIVTFAAALGLALAGMLEVDQNAASDPVSTAASLLFLPLLAILFFVRSKGANLVMLIVLNLLVLTEAIALAL